MMLDLVLRQLGRHKTRTILTVLGVAIGILLVTTLSSFSEGISSTVNNELSYLSGMVTVTSEGIGFENFEQSEVDEGIVDEIADMGGVERTSAFIASSVPGIGSVYGANPDDLDLFNMDVKTTEGRWMENGEDEVVLGHFYAEKSGLRVGDYMEMRGKKYEVVGIFEEIGSEEDYGVVTSLESAQDLLGMDDKVTIIMVKPSDLDYAEDIAREINDRYDNVHAISEKDAQRGAAEFTGQLGFLTFSLGSIAAIIAGLGIMNVMFMSVRERRKEIGAMKALGATNREVLGQVVMEALFITLIGCAIGVFLSYGSVGIINNTVGQAIAIITVSLVFKVAVFAIFLGVISGILPAREAARLDPAAVLRYE